VGILDQKPLKVRETSVSMSSFISFRDSLCQFVNTPPKPAFSPANLGLQERCCFVKFNRDAQLFFMQFLPDYLTL